MQASITIYPFTETATTGGALTNPADGLYMAATAATPVVITKIGGGTQDLGLVPIGTFLPFPFVSATFTPAGAVVACRANRGSLTGA